MNVLLYFLKIAKQSFATGWTRKVKGMINVLLDVWQGVLKRLVEALPFV